MRDIGLSGLGAWLVCVVLGYVLGSAGGRPPTSSLAQFDSSFPVALVAATVGVATAAFPYLSRWLQLSLEVGIGLLAVATVVHGSGFPVAVAGQPRRGLGDDGTGPPGLRLAAGTAVDKRGRHAARRPRHRRRGHRARPASRTGASAGSTVGSDRSRIDVSVYGRDASDAQLLAKTARFVFYRDSGPTLALTRRQQVEHEAYLTMMAERAGARVPEVLAAGPAGPARDALLVTRPPAERPLADLRPSTSAPPEDEAAGD